MRRRALFAVGTMILAGLSLTACPPTEQADPAALQAAEDLAWLRENKPALEAKRQELREVRDRIAGKTPEGDPEGEAEGDPEGEAEGDPEGEAEGDPEGEAEGDPEGEAEGDPAPTPEELEGQATAVAAEIETLTEQLGERVVSYLNNAGIVVGAELTPDQQFAIDVKIDEDIRIAQEYIDQGGDYGRAIEIYRQAQQLDVQNEKLKAKIAEAEDLRWMNEERFAQVKKKMTQDEVREFLGAVMHNNIRDYRPDREVVAWFYRKLDGGAAGVFFKESRKGNEEWLVYNLDYNAVEKQVVGEDDG